MVSGIGIRAAEKKESLNFIHDITFYCIKQTPATEDCIPPFEHILIVCMLYLPFQTLRQFSQMTVHLGNAGLAEFRNKRLRHQLAHF